MLTKVKDSPSLVRAQDSKAILNTDTSSLQAYKLKREREKRHDEIIQQWDTVVEEVSVIKQMLGNILTKLEKIEGK